jgi:hypothetical protein
MSLAEQMESDVADVLLQTDEHAGTVTRYPAGDTGTPLDVTAIFEPETADRDRRRGDETVRPALLYVAAMQTLDPNDTWEIAGDRYATVTVGTPDAGLVAVELRRTERRHTKPENTDVF